MIRCLQGLSRWVDDALLKGFAPGTDQIRRSQARLVAGAALMNGLAGAMLIPALLLVVGASSGTIVTMVAWPIVSFLPLFLLRMSRLQAAAAVFMGVLFLALTFVVSDTGGLNSPALGWLVVVPVFGVATLRRRAAAGLAVATLGVLVALFTAEHQGFVFEGPVPELKRLLLLVCNVPLAITIFLFAVYWQASRQRAFEELRTRDEQLERSNRLRSLGTLAGGVAHDFNNLLTVIVSYAELLSEDDETQRRADVDVIRDAVQQGKRLTSQLLSYGRKQVLEPETLDSAVVLRRMGSLLSRVLRADIDLHVDVAEDVPFIRVDRARFEQVIMNIVLNARDAMSGGGELDVRAFPRSREGVEGVCFSFRDTGTGMSQEVENRLFEPFFTTKRLGSGTGLGLATAYGTVTQSGGSLEVETEMGVGSTFYVWMPAAEPPEQTEESPMQSSEPCSAPARVIYAEDNEDVRRATVRALQREGFTVDAFSDGTGVLQTLGDNPHDYDVVLTDVASPRWAAWSSSESCAAEGFGYRSSSSRVTRATSLPTAGGCLLAVRS